MLQYTLKVVEVKVETKDTVTICFKQPALKKVKYQAGQYLTLILNINNRRYFRPYSFSSAPEVDATLNVTVKKVTDGLISNYIADYIKIGDTVEVLQPLGNFTLESKNIPYNSCLVFWGAGSGITPLFAIIKHALSNNLAKQVLLVYGNRDQENTIFYQQINELQKKYPEIFSIKHFHTNFTDNKSTIEFMQGRIDSQLIVNQLKGNNNLKNSYHFICGPAGLRQSVENVLIKEVIPQNRIFYESFELILDPKNFEGISTQNVTIKTAVQEYQVEVLKGKTILEAGLDAMIDLSYSCQTGTCLLCKAKLLSGKIKVISTDDDPKELDEGEYLLCCSLPLTNNIKLLVS